MMRFSLTSVVHYVQHEWWHLMSFYIAIRLRDTGHIKIRDPIEGNYKTDELASKGTHIHIPPRFRFLRALDLWASRELSKRWAATSTCRVTKAFWPRVVCKRSIELDEVDISKLFLLHCLTFARLCLKHLRCHNFYEPGELAGFR